MFMKFDLEKKKAKYTVNRVVYPSLEIAMHECALFFGLLFISKPMHPFAWVIESIRFDVAELMLSIINFTQHIHKSIK